MNKNINLEDYRKQDFTLEEKIFFLLLGIFISVLLLTNIITSKYFIIGKIPMTAGVITYPFTFLITDIISEVYGKEKAKYTVWMGFGASILMVFIIWIANYSPTHLSSPVKQHYFQKVFGFTPGIVIGSMTAYLVSQFSDVYIFDSIKKITGDKLLWIRNNIATIVSQLIDTFTFALTAWVIWPIIDPSNATVLISWDVWLKIAACEFIFKIFFALLDTPFVYLGVFFIKKLIKKTGSKNNTYQSGK